MNNAHLSFEAESGLLSVRHFHVEEKMSGLFRITAQALSPFDSLDLASYIGQRAELGIHGASPRRWRGLCVEMRMARTAVVGEQGQTTYDIEIVPTLWRLTQRRGNRLFQHISIPDIVTRLLGEWNIAHAWQIDAKRYPRLELRTQYDETDFTFVSRLLEEAGISFYLVDEGDQDSTLVLHDAPQSVEPRARSVAFVDDVFQSLAGQEEHVTKVTLREASRPGTVTLRDHDPRKPRLPLYARAASDRGAEAAHEQYRHLPGSFLREEGAARGPSVAAATSAALSATGGASPAALTAAQAAQILSLGETPVADDRGVARMGEKRGEALAQLMIEAMHSDRRVVTFETNAPDLRPGVVFAISGHPRFDVSGDTQLLMTHLVIDGDLATTEAWRFAGTAVPAGRPYRPAMTTPKQRLYGIQSAVVVGPQTGLLGTASAIAGATADLGAVAGALPGQAGAAARIALDGAATAAALLDNEIYVDELGRVRVQFNWDREGQFDGNSSIWMRVSQGWAGGGYGFFTIPRVGHEVLVSFLDGDPDAPIVVGSVHNVVEPVPFKLPENKTVSTWKTASSPGGAGFNELRFDDAAGREHLYLQAQKDMDHLVKNDFKEAVGHNRSRSAQNDDVVAVGHDRVKVVNHNEVEATGLNRSSVVGLSRAATVGVEDSTLVGTRWSVTVARGLTRRLARELDGIASGPLGGVLRGAASTMLGLLPNSPLGRAAEATLSDFGAAAVGKIKNVLSVLDGFEAAPGPPPTAIEMVDRQIKLSTGEASIILDGPNVIITAQGSITFHAMKSISVLGEEEVAIAAREKAALISTGDDVLIQAKGNVHLNPYESKKRVDRAARIDGSIPDGVRRCDVCGEELVEGDTGAVCVNAVKLEYGSE
jgi:type VI secretion system secreted protein VgrG